jgi:hypothetical protein
MVLALVAVEPAEHEAKHQQIKGALYMLSNRSVAKAINANFGWLQAYMQRMPRLQSNEKRTIMELIAKSFGSLRAEFRTRNLAVAVPDACFATATVLNPAVSARLSGT